MAWAAIIGAVVQAVAANQANKKAGAGNPDTSRIAANEEQRAADQYGTYKNLYAPRERQLLDTAFDQSRTPAAEAARAGAEARRSSDNAEQIGLRSARRIGINPSSPAFAALQRNTQANEAGLEAASRTGGRRFAQDSNFKQQMEATALGRNLVTNSGNSLNSAADLYGGLESVRAQREGAAGRMYGQAAEGLISGISDLYKSRQPKTTNTGGASTNTNTEPASW